MYTKQGYKVQRFTENQVKKNGVVSSTREQKRAFKRELKTMEKRRQAYIDRRWNTLHKARSSFWESLKELFSFII